MTSAKRLAFMTVLPGLSVTRLLRPCVAAPSQEESWSGQGEDVSQGTRGDKGGISEKNANQND